MKKLSQFLFAIKRFFVKGLVVLFVPSPKRHYVREIILKGGLFHSLAVSNRLRKAPQTSDKYYLSILACCKDEGDYIQEWIEYYLLQGVDHFYLYNNNGTDNSKEILTPYIEKGIVTWIDWPGKRQQINIYNNGVQRFKDETRWLAIVDLDEFIVPMNNKRLADTLTEFEAYNQILLHWVIYGSSGHIQKTPGLVLERFKHHQEGVWPLTKAIVNPKAVVYAHVHSSVVLGKTVDEKKNILPKMKTIIPSADYIKINHYVIKSQEEFLKKKNKGRTLGNFTDDFFKDHDRNEVSDTMDMAPIINTIKKNMESMK